MSTGHVIQTIIELIMVVGVIVAVFYEPVIADWERKQGEKMLKAFNKRNEYRK